MTFSPVYNIEKSFEENVTYGPSWTTKAPQVPHTSKRYAFLGRPVTSLFGIAASPLTFGSRNVLFFSRLGYDILTYRSVRSVEWRGLAYPHWRYVDVVGQLRHTDLGKPLMADVSAFPQQEVSMANSFGIQSLSPSLWQQDYEVAKQGLQPGQLLILALMVTPETGRSVVIDASLVAQLATKTTAEILEINLACPNSGKSSLVYEDVDLSVAICRAVRAQIGKRKLLAKVGFYQDSGVLRTFLSQTRGIIDGISSTNTYGMKVVDSEGGEVFPGRPTAGVSGGAIRSLSMDQARAIVALKKELHLPELAVIGIGGVMQPAHIAQYLALGVQAVQSVVGVYADPMLAIGYKKTLLK